MPPLEMLDTILPGLPQSPCQAPTGLAHHIPSLTVTLKVSANVQWGRLLRQRQERLPTAPMRAPPTLELT